MPRIKAGDTLVLRVADIAPLAAVWLSAAKKHEEFLRRRYGMLFSEGTMRAMADLAEIAEEARQRKIPEVLLPDEDPGNPPVANKARPLSFVTIAIVDTDEIIVGLRAAAAVRGCAAESLRERCIRRTIPFDRDRRGRYLFRRTDLEARSA